MTRGLFLAAPAVCALALGLLTCAQATVVPLTAPQGGFTIEVAAPPDETINFDTASDTGVPSAASFMVSVDNAYDSYRWMLDGEILAGETTGTATVVCAALALGVHHMTAVVSKDGILYSKSLRFFVEN